ncbi:MAG: ion transporter [Halieaceae bacterium]|nr:ion transporter [Halieaceae bacterium]
MGDVTPTEHRTTDRSLIARVRARTAEILDLPDQGDHASRLADIAIIVLIVINIVAMTLETVPSLRHAWGVAFGLIERISLIVFSVEYLLRVWSIIDSKWREEYRHPLWGRLRFMLSPMAIVDLLAVLPFWLQMFFPIDLRFLRIVRLLRVLKLTRYSAATNLLFEVVREKARVLGASLFMLFLLLVFAATAAYLVENQAQPESFGSIPAALWWCIVTVTTVGYGDVVPITAAGKIIGSVLGFIGVAIVALPAGILSAGFSDALDRRRNTLRKELQRALIDQVVDDNERRDLEWEGQKLSLSKKQIEAILAENSSAGNSGVTSGVAPAHCPHCGKTLSIPSE